jgi:electron transfer flavoprotein alpha subunit
MGEILVVVEHRQGEVREISKEMLFKAGELCRSTSNELVAVVLADNAADSIVPEVAKMAERVLVFQDDRFNNFDSHLYREVLAKLVQERNPFLTLMGHTSWGMDLAPALSIKSGYPLATDCVDIVIEDGRPSVVRQIYSGKLFSRVSFRESTGYLITVRPGAFLVPEGEPPIEGKIEPHELYPDMAETGKEFLEFVDTGAGDVDITQAELLVSVGRGVGEEENIADVQELADVMGGTLSCSRPVVDKNWLPKYHQVGTSGKSVKPKVYFALGISGAFQHVAGIAGAGTVIAVNKDPKAPIFRVADYGVVDDLFNVVSALKEKL